jgi:hypothetical protein
MYKAGLAIKRYSILTASTYLVIEMQEHERIHARGIFHPRDLLQETWPQIISNLEPTLPRVTCLVGMNLSGSAMSNVESFLPNALLRLTCCALNDSGGLHIIAQHVGACVETGVKPHLPTAMLE